MLLIICHITYNFIVSILPIFTDLYYKLKIFSRFDQTVLFPRTKNQFHNIEEFRRKRLPDTNRYSIGT
jgi:hypothetical protein